MPKTSSPWPLIARILAAAPGGYALTALITLVLSLLMHRIGIGKAEAVLTSTMTSFLLYTGIIMAIFHTRTARRAWIGLIIAAVPCGVIIALFRLTGAI